MKKGTGKKIASILFMGVMTGGLVFGNNMAMQNQKVITSFLCGTGDNFGNAAQTLAASDELCQKIGDESIVLLKNQNNALPLAADVKGVNLFGYGATEAGFLLRGVGSGSSTISELNKVTLSKALKDGGYEVNEKLLKVYDDYASAHASSFRPASAGSGNVYRLAEPPVSTIEAELEEAKEFSDVAIFVVSRDGGENVGEIPKNQGDGKTYLEITNAEQATLDLLKENFGTVIVLINTTNTMHTGFLADDGIDAAMYVGLTGQSAAKAIPKILSGETNPSGKVADTYTYAYNKDYDPTSANENFYYMEDIYFGYKWYETAEAEGYFDTVSNEYGEGYDGVVQYPLGYGLSYTSFEWEVDEVSVAAGSVLSQTSEVTVSVLVTNKGKEAGKDVVQLYYTPPYTNGGIEKAEVNLLDFAKTPLINPGETAKVTLSFNAYGMASYDAYDKNDNGFTGYELEKGTYKVSLRTDAHTVDDCAGAEIEYKVNNDIQFENDPTTGNPVSNHFTGDAAYAGVPTDGSNVGLEQNWLSRSDFKGTFPKSAAKAPTNTSKINSAANYMNDAYDTTTMPTTGASNGLLLTTLTDGSKATERQLNGYDLEKDNPLVYDDDLVKELAADYNSDTWEDLLDQMTAQEMKDLVEQGGFRRIAVESIGSPYQCDYDGPAGFNVNSLTGNWGGGDPDTASWTAFPSEALMACSWNEDLMFELGRSMGAEASKTSINGWYAPGVNMHRSAYNARNYEYYSEDAVLSGKMAAMVIWGAKTNGLSCYLKHFACSEPGPNPGGQNTWLTEQNLRENYLKPFEICVKEGKANAMMSAFNRVGATWAGANYALLTQVLREEWGFKGAVITDWTGGTAGKGGMNVNQGVRAGNDLWLCPNVGSWTGGNSLSVKNATEMACARRAAHNLLYMAVDSRATFLEYKDKNPNDIYTSSGQIGFKDEVYAWWIPALVTLDATIGMLFATWFVSIVRPSKKEEIL